MIKIGTNVRVRMPNGSVFEGYVVRMRLDKRRGAFNHQKRVFSIVVSTLYIVNFNWYGCRRERAFEGDCVDEL